jgi:hypothetical protein
MFRRTLGILTFRRATCLEIAKDKKAIGQAFTLVVISSLLYGFIGAAAIEGDWANAWRGTIAQVIGRGTVNSFFEMAGWVVGAVLIVLIARMFKGKTTLGEMLRVTGFVQVFTILAFLSAFVLTICGLASAVLLVIFIIGFLELGGYVVGICETAGITTGKALIASLVADFISFVAATFFADLILGVLKIPGV